MIKHIEDMLWSVNGVEFHQQDFVSVNDMLDFLDEHNINWNELTGDDYKSFEKLANRVASAMIREVVLNKKGRFTYRDLMDYLSRFPFYKNQYDINDNKDIKVVVKKVFVSDSELE